MNLEGNTPAQENNVSQLPVSLSLSQPAKTLVLSYYCLYSLFNKIRDKDKIVSAWYRGGWVGEGGDGVGGKGGGGGRGDAYLHAHMSNKKIKQTIKNQKINLILCTHACKWKNETC
jgi:hypothetical protein